MIPTLVSKDYDTRFLVNKFYLNYVARPDRQEPQALLFDPFSPLVT